MSHESRCKPIEQPPNENKFLLIYEIKAEGSTPGDSQRSYCLYFLDIYPRLQENPHDIHRGILGHLQAYSITKIRKEKRIFIEVLLLIFLDISWRLREIRGKSP